MQERLKASEVLSRDNLFDIGQNVDQLREEIEA